MDHVHLYEFPRSTHKWQTVYLVQELGKRILLWLHSRSLRLPLSLHWKVIHTEPGKSTTVAEKPLLLPLSELQSGVLSHTGAFKLGVPSLAPPSKLNQLFIALIGLKGNESWPKRNKTGDSGMDSHLHSLQWTTNAWGWGLCLVLSWMPRIWDVTTCAWQTCELAKWLSD